MAKTPYSGEMVRNNKKSYSYNPWCRNGRSSDGLSQEEPDRNVSGQAHVADCLDKSLKRLGLDYVDLYIYHMW